MGVLLIDGSNLAYRVFSQHKDAAIDEALTGYTRALNALKHRFGPRYELYVLWDGHPQWRYDLLPSYKGNRGATETDKLQRERVKSYIAKLKQELVYFGVTQIVAPEAEADDVAAYLANTYSEKTQVVLVSEDQDWVQIVLRSKKNVWLCSKRTGSVEGKDALTVLHGSLDQFLDVKALQGDTSDNIPGWPGVGEKTAYQYVAGDTTSNSRVRKIRDGVASNSEDFQNYLVYRKIMNLDPAHLEKYIKGKLLVTRPQTIGT